MEGGYVGVSAFGKYTKCLGVLGRSCPEHALKGFNKKTKENEHTRVYTHSRSAFVASAYLLKLIRNSQINTCAEW